MNKCKECGALVVLQLTLQTQIVFVINIFKLSSVCLLRWATPALPQQSRSPGHRQLIIAQYFYSTLSFCSCLVVPLKKSVLLTFSHSLRLSVCPVCEICPESWHLLCFVLFFFCKNLTALLPSGKKLTKKFSIVSKFRFNAQSALTLNNHSSTLIWHCMKFTNCIKARTSLLNTAVTGNVAGTTKDEDGVSFDTIVHVLFRNIKMILFLWFIRFWGIQLLDHKGCYLTFGVMSLSSLFLLPFVSFIVSFSGMIYALCKMSREHVKEQQWMTNESLL